MRQPKPRIAKDAGGYPHTLECPKCKHRWFQPVSGDDCPWCAGTASNITANDFLGSRRKPKKGA